MSITGNPTVKAAEEKADAAKRELMAMMAENPRGFAYSTLVDAGFSSDDPVQRSAIASEAQTYALLAIADELKKVHATLTEVNRKLAANLKKR